MGGAALNRGIDKGEFVCRLQGWMMKTDYFKLLGLLAAMTVPALSQDQAPGAEKSNERRAVQPGGPAPQIERARARAQRWGQFQEGGGPRIEAAKPQKEESAGWRIGVVGVPVEDELRVHLDIPKEAGVVVKEVMPNGPADKAGIRKSDIILKANDKPIASMEQLHEAVAAAGASHSPLHLLVIQGGKRGEVTVENDMPKPDQRPTRQMQPPQESSPRGLMMAPRMMEEMRARMGSLTERVEKQQRELDELRKFVRERFRDEDRKEKSETQKEEKRSE